ncbi:hypothetical protein HKX23_03410 [Sulfitobacter sp. KE29]|nr:MULTISPECIES: hypothetical protein [unclassified Sulfitobacter]MDF3417391.1 hypothetical protein [Sulfitobacter sp. Ks38]MDF3424873.1 hypothetical protein [Sulfitobacter sp. KE29]MDF3428454.1 hypothetical protein [Sulfitobacter sp. S46]MDF3443226.1 hypothetical protein [Sulfitobacter sp. KE31]MDF3547251.1 hypothetical protein [Sulfitobacter sp. KE28]
MFSNTVLSSAVFAEGACETCFSAQYWKTPDRGVDYPEMQDDAFRRSRASFGVAFQGGGNRAAPAALGQLRALHNLGWIEKIRYISAISGGSWTAIPYTYLKEHCAPSSNVYCAEDLFLGKYYSPAALGKVLPQIITLAKNKGTDVNSIPGFAPGSMLGAIGRANVTRKMFKAWKTGRFDESYSETLGKIYLEPFGLGRTKPSDPDSLFTWRRIDEDRIRSSRKNRPPTEVHYVERDRPYLIVGGTLSTQRIAINPQNKFRMEMTPLYTGMPVRRFPYDDGVGVGGGFVESHGYDHVTHRVETVGEETVLLLKLPQYGARIDRSRLNFSLSNMAAISGAAPVETFVNLPVVQGLLSNFGFPEHYTPIDQAVGDEIKLFAEKGNIYQKEWAHGDGGHEDNLGLAPLLARQVENIIVFANAYAPLDARQVQNCRKAFIALDKAPKGAQLKRSVRKTCERDMIGADLASFFVQTEDQIHNVGLTMLKNEGSGLTGLRRKYEDLLTLAEDLVRQRNVSCEEYHYDPAASVSHGIAYTPTICVVFLGLETAWAQPLLNNAPPSHRPEIMKALEIAPDGNSLINRRWMKGFRSSGFPHLGTFFDQDLHIIDTAPPRLFALSNLTAWKLQDADTLKQIKDAFFKNGLILE